MSDPAADKSEFVVAELVNPSAMDFDAIGRLRYDVWAGEGSIDAPSFPSGVWVDDVDASARHWVAKTREGRFVAAARLVLHFSIATADRDVELWLKGGRNLAFPVADLGRLVVTRGHRGCGIASAINRARIDAAREAGAATVITTASASNRRLLLREGFVDTGERVEFSDRPGTVFHALELQLRVPQPADSPASEPF